MLVNIHIYICIHIYKHIHIQINIGDKQQGQQGPVFCFSRHAVKLFRTEKIFLPIDSGRDPEKIIF